MSRGLDKQIVSYLPLLGNEEKKSLISVIRSFLNLKNETNGAMSIEEYNHELEEAEAGYHSGDYISQEEMKNLVKQW